MGAPFSLPKKSVMSGAILKNLFVMDMLMWHLKLGSVDVRFENLFTTVAICNLWLGIFAISYNFPNL